MLDFGDIENTPLNFSPKAFAYDTYNSVSIFLIPFLSSLCAFSKGKSDITGSFNAYKNLTVIK